MMMISNNPFDKLRPSRRRSRYRTFFVLFVLVLLVGAAALWRVPLQNTLMGVLRPILQARFAAGTPAASTEALVADRDALYKENLDLKMRLGRTVTTERMLAAVLMRPPATPYDTLAIDVGAALGVAEGDTVSAGGGALIGTISQVSEAGARVTLYSAPAEKYDALLSLHVGGRLPVTVVGMGGGSMSAQVPAGSGVAVGDEVLFAGIVGGISGRVVGVEAGIGESFATIYLRLPVNPQSLQFVEVLKKN